MQVRLRAALAADAAVACVSTESELMESITASTRLILIHGVDAFADARLPGRIRKALKDERATIVVLASSRVSAWAQADDMVATGTIDDIIRTDTENVDPLVAAWAEDDAHRHRRVEALRLAHLSAPACLHPLFEELLRYDAATLSVAGWAKRKTAGSRFALRRDLLKTGCTPSSLVDSARTLDAVARVLVHTRACGQGQASALPEVRATRRLLSNALGLCPREAEMLTRGEGDVAAMRQRAVDVVRRKLRPATTTATE